MIDFFTMVIIVFTAGVCVGSGIIEGMLEIKANEQGDNK